MAARPPLAKTPARASVVMGQSAAAQYGITLKPSEHYDPWLGLKTDDALVPTNGTDTDAVRAALSAMRASADACERLSARFVTDQGTGVVFKPLAAADGPDETAEAGYNNDANQIWINSSARYLRHPDNLRKKIVHESFHRAQAVMGIYNPRRIHAYEDRPRITAYLQSLYPSEGKCVLPEVPAGIRGKVPDTVSAARMPVLSGPAYDALRSIAVPPSAPDTARRPAPQGYALAKPFSAGGLPFDVRTSAASPGEKKLFYMNAYAVDLKPVSGARPWTGDAPDKEAVAFVTWNIHGNPTLRVGAAADYDDETFGFPWPRGAVVDAVDVDYRGGRVSVRLRGSQTRFDFDLISGRALPAR